MTVFIVPLGLEHTGHHLWVSISNKIDVKKLDTNISTNLFFLNYLDYKNASFYEKHDIRRKFKTSVHSRNFQQEKLSILCYCSFPCFEDSYNPDTIVMDSIMNNYDTRYFLLTRAPEEIVYRFTIERVKSLITSTKKLIMYVQYLQAKKRRILCIPYKSTLEYTHEISNFVGTNISTVIHDTFKIKKKYINNSLKNAHIWHMFESESNKLDSLCNS